MSFLAALRQDRIDGERYRLYVEKIPLPTLHPGDNVIIDNLGSHRGTRQIIRWVAARFFVLPPEILARLEADRTAGVIWPELLPMCRAGQRFG